MVCMEKVSSKGIKIGGIVCRFEQLRMQLCVVVLTIIDYDL